MLLIRRDMDEAFNVWIAKVAYYGNRPRFKKQLGKRLRAIKREMIYENAQV